ncbi:TPA: virulence protein [Escherichia coli]|nr:virulence protein [Salmonella enterica]EFC6422159.1 virulence protein [Escherichia coli]HDT0319466.1 virulence protein [Citrobacter amalonaticus]EBI2149768.1 virulence protein [Salmonella enterica]ECG8000558.1 virulence protein [Salmonella enterica]
MEDFHLLVVLQPPQLKNSASHGATRHARRTYATSADVNGTRNILAAGHAVLACEEMVQSGLLLKQEPTEMIPAIA